MKNQNLQRPRAISCILARGHCKSINLCQSLWVPWKGNILKSDCTFHPIRVLMILERVCGFSERKRVKPMKYWSLAICIVRTEPVWWPLPHSGLDFSSTLRHASHFLPHCNPHPQWIDVESFVSIERMVVDILNHATHVITKMLFYGSLFIINPFLIQCNRTYTGCPHWNETTLKRYNFLCINLRMLKVGQLPHHISKFLNLKLILCFGLNYDDPTIRGEMCGMDGRIEVTYPGAMTIPYKVWQGTADSKRSGCMDE